VPNVVEVDTTTKTGILTGLLEETPPLYCGSAAKGQGTNYVSA
jgi:hypothetical protein